MKREKRLTKRERKSLDPSYRPGPRNKNTHIHCIACGRHLEPTDFDDPASATVLSCQHGTDFPACIGCITKARELLAEHDRTGLPVKTANAWH